MRGDRRGFLRALASALVLLGGRRALAEADVDVEDLDIHQATRNTLWGAIGELRPRLQRAPPPYRPHVGLRRLALPPPDEITGAPLEQVIRDPAPPRDFADAPLSLKQLGHLLHYTNGLTGESPRRKESGRMRAAPSAGALYAGEIDVLVDRVTGLSPGHYYYDVRAHALVPVAEGVRKGRAASALAQPQVVAHAAALIIVSNVFSRYTWRYANRGYRYALIDTGHIVENLRLAAGSMGLAELEIPEFEDDRLNDLLGLDGRGEAVCAVCAVGLPGQTRSASPAASERRLVQRRHNSEIAGLAKGSVIERYHEATKLVGVEEQALGRPERIPPVALTLPAAAPIVLARRSESTGMAVEACIDQRRSPLHFSEDALTLAELAFVLEMAAAHPQLERATGVELWIAAHRVAGLAPGLYRYRSQALERVRSGAIRDELVRACLRQEMAGSAAVGCLHVAELGAQGERGRDRSYRDVLVEAGAAAQRIYLAAEALGRGARNLAAFRDDKLNALLGIDGRSRAVIHLTMLGVGK